MASFSNTAAGGVNGAAVTVANSGGASGDPWTTVNVPAGTTVTYQSAGAYMGTMSYRFTQGSGSGTGAYLRRSVSGQTQLRDRFYFKTAAYPSVSAVIAYVSQNDGPGTLVARVVLTPAGSLGIWDVTGTLLFSSGPIGLNTDIRVEWIVAPGTTSSNGTVKFGWAAGEAAIAGGNTFSSTTANVGTFPLRNVAYGKWAGTWNTTTYFNQIRGDDTSSSSFIGTLTVAPAPVPPPPVSSPLWPPDPYRQAIRNGVKLSYFVTAWFGGEVVSGATDLRPTGGNVTDTTKPGVRRVLNLELAPSPGLFDLLSPIGTTLAVFAKVTYTDGTSLDIPMGVFDVDTESLTEGGGGISLTAPDKWAKIQRHRFVTPFAPFPSNLITDLIVLLIRGALGATEPVVVNSTSSATVGAMVFEKDRDKAIIDLAEAIGCWVYFDRNGVATVDPIPTVGSTADWLIDASPSGVLTELKRERSRANTRNVVVVESSQAGEAAFPVQIVWDDDPFSPTYAGVSPIVLPDTAGPFGIVTEYLDIPLPMDYLAAREAGRTRLARVMGLASQVSLGQVPNPAVDAFDVIDVLPPPERYDIPRVLERHIVDTVTHPLTLGPVQQIDGRAVRLSEIVGGS